MAQPRPIQSVGVVGGGTMGAGIAVALLSAGLSVVMVERDEAALAQWRQLEAHRMAQAAGRDGVFADYRLPLDPLRAELQRVLETAPEWDRRVNVLQLTDVTERTIQIRVLVSARSSSLAFDLRCRVREALVTFIQREYPDCLPQVRVPAQGAEAPTRPLEQEPPLKA